jgi:pimeloyl-ACP methyl ester carboxylesterase
VVLVMSASVVGGSPAVGDPAPGDRVLAGYRIVEPELRPRPGPSGPSRVFQGVVGYAAYAAEVPAAWNGSLVLVAHGWVEGSDALIADAPGWGMRAHLIDAGFAWAASSYFDNGYDVRAGVLSTHDLVAQLAPIIGRPTGVYVLGVSMGGQIAAELLDRFPTSYRGALVLCGVLGGSAMFDSLADVNLLAAALDPADPVERVQLDAIIARRTGGARPAVGPSIAYWLPRLLGRWHPDAPGPVAANPSRLGGNLHTVYEPSEPIDANARIARHAPTDSAVRSSRWLTESPVIGGRPRVPVLTLHDIGDLFVPLSMEQDYAAALAKHHRSSLLVQRAIRAAGHCEFSDAEVTRAWDDLVSWTASGVRPDGDAVTDPTAVSDPAFGCRFTDVAAPASPTGVAFEPCTSRSG